MSKLAIVTACGIGLATVFMGNPAFSAPPELRERAEAIQREADELAERGRLEQAERLRREARELLERSELEERQRELGEAAERRELQERRRQEREERERAELEARRRAERRQHERAEHGHRAALLRELEAHHRELDQLQAEAREAERAGNEELLERIRDQMAAGEERIADLRREVEAHDHERGHHEAGEHEEGARFPRVIERRELAEMARRIEHMRVAADHLQEAGMADLADELRQNAHRLQNELIRARERQEHVHQPGREPLDEIRDTLADLAEQVRALREEVRELRGRID